MGRALRVYSERLLAKLEQATGPDQEIDILIWLCLGKVLAHPNDNEAWQKRLPMAPHVPVNARTLYQAYKLFPTDLRGMRRCWNIPSFTASMDAAMTLMPEGWYWDIRKRQQGYLVIAFVVVAEKGNHSYDEMFQEEAPTAQLAFCRAALRAHGL